MHIATKKSLLKKWIGQYINKFKEKNVSQEEIKKYEYLLTAIDFSLSKDSIKKVNHLFDIRNKIKTHIINNHFNKEYKKLNEKLNWNMNKLINQIYLIDIKTEENGQLYRIAVLNKEDLDLFQNKKVYEND